MHLNEEQLKGRKKKRRAITKKEGTKSLSTLQYLS
jgi:hypothetical protein